MEKRFACFVVFLSFIGFSFLFPGGALSAVISENGASEYKIVIPGDATVTEQYAADELAAFLEQIGGAGLEIVPEGDGFPEKAIVLGPVAAAINEIGAEKYEALGLEGFVLRTSGDTLYITGARPRGTLYGVYALLEEKLGCRWYAPGAEIIPSLDKIEIPDLDETQIPAFEYREPYFKHAFNADWAARNRVNGSSMRLDEKHGGRIAYSHFVHTFNALVPPADYFDEHPEYFTEIDDPENQESRLKTQLCVNEEDVLKIAKERVMQWMEDAPPDARIFSVSQNDNVRYCEREGDRALEIEEGSPAGPLLYFVNEIADEAAKRFPDNYIDTLAYQYTEVAPKNVRPRPNVIIRLCHMAPSCDTHPLDKCFWNEKYMQNLKQWTAISDKVYVWHYVTDFHHYLMPFPDVKAIARDIPTYHKYGVQGMFAQGSSESPGGNLAELKAWLISKLLWNPDADVKALIVDFHNGYYGPAAPAMLDYLNALHSGVEDRSAHAHLYSSPSEIFLPPDVVQYADKCFDRAEELAANDPEILKRVQRDRLGIMYLKLVAPRLFGWSKEDLQPGGPQDQLARLEEFTALLEEHGVNVIKEWHKLDVSLASLREIVDSQLE